MFLETQTLISSFDRFLANLKAFRLRIVMLLLGPCVMMQEFLFSFFFPAVFARSLDIEEGRDEEDDGHAANFGVTGSHC
jgi:hypothetical protein